MFADTLLIVFISVCTALLAEGEAGTRGGGGGILRPAVPALAPDGPAALGSGVGAVTQAWVRRRAWGPRPGRRRGLRWLVGQVSRLTFRHHLGPGVPDRQVQEAEGRSGETEQKT